MTPGLPCCARGGAVEWASGTRSPGTPVRGAEGAVECAFDTPVAVLRPGRGCRVGLWHQVAWYAGEGAEGRWTARLARTRCEVPKGRWSARLVPQVAWVCVRGAEGGCPGGGGWGRLASVLGGEWARPHTAPASPHGTGGCRGSGGVPVRHVH